MISYAQNREDVVLWRALHAVGTGRYAEIAADDGRGESATRVFADHGWAGLAIVGEVDGDDATTVEPSGYAAGDVHLLVVDARGVDRQAPGVQPVDLPLSDLRPWVVVVSGADDHAADAWDAELGAAGYERCLYDGVSRFYLADGHDDLRPALSYPACARDDFTDRREAELVDEVARLEAAVRQARDESLDELLRWRHAAVSTWAKTAATRANAATGSREYQQLQAALAAAQRDAAEVRRTLSWRVTKPLRMAKSAGRRS